MRDTLASVAFLLVAGAGTALACGLGAIPVFLLGERAAWLRPALWGLAAGLMAVASVEGLLRPALRSGSPGQAGAGLLGGVLFLLAMRRGMRGRDVRVGDLRGAGVRRSALVFAVLLVHSLPEGLAMGAAHASGSRGLSLFVLAAIALQNVPEGTAVAIPMASAGFGKGQQFWAAVLTSVPQPIGAPLAYLLVERVAPLLPVSLAFAAGAMLAVVVAELVPEAFTRATWRGATGGALVGAALMLALSAALGV
ncbi:MAG TPA: ZIP family metal transporter [Vicinamibacteria bacterium]